MIYLKMSSAKWFGFLGHDSSLEDHTKRCVKSTLIACDIATRYGMWFPPFWTCRVFCSAKKSIELTRFTYFSICSCFSRITWFNLCQLTKWYVCWCFNIVLIMFGLPFAFLYCWIRQNINIWLPPCHSLANVVILSAAMCLICGRSCDLLPFIIIGKMPHALVRLQIPVWCDQLCIYEYILTGICQYIHNV